MTSTPFSKQVEIVADFYLEYADEYPELTDIYDLGFPLAVAYSQGAIAEFTPMGIDFINETFLAICETLGLDSYGDYDSLDDMVAFDE